MSSPSASASPCLARSVLVRRVASCCGILVHWTNPYCESGRANILVLPAASRPSISRRISLLPKILAIEREMAAPMVIVLWVLCDYLSFWKESDALSAIVSDASLLFGGRYSRLNCEAYCSTMAVLCRCRDARDVDLLCSGSGVRLSGQGPS